MQPWASPGPGPRKPWRYLPELLRDLERTPGDEPCAVCGGDTDALQGPRARLTWCPECMLLSIHDGPPGRGPALLGPLGRVKDTASPPGMAPGSGIP